MKKKTAIWIKIIVLGYFDTRPHRYFNCGDSWQHLPQLSDILALFPAMTMPICIRWEMLIFLHPELSSLSNRLGKRLRKS